MVVDRIGRKESELTVVEFRDEVVVVMFEDGRSAMMADTGEDDMDIWGMAFYSVHFSDNEVQTLSSDYLDFEPQPFTTHSDSIFQFLFQPILFDFRLSSSCWISRYVCRR